MNLIEAPSTRKSHRYNTAERRTRCGLAVGADWRPLALLGGEQPTCLHCRYPTKADREAAA